VNTCLCGNMAGTMRCSRCAALHALDLEMDATEAEIRKAYRLLVKVWHPDRFQSDQKLKEAAETKLKDVNTAFEFLTSTADERGPWRPPPCPATDAAPSASREATATEDPASSEFSAGAQTPIQMPDLTPRLRLWPTTRFCVKVVAVLFALLLGRYLWIAFDAPDPTGGDVARVYDKGKERIFRGLEAPKKRFIDAVEHDLGRLDPRDSAAAQPEIPQTGQTEPSASQQSVPAAPQIANSQHPEKITSAPPKILPYITVGSTRDEVLAQQGTPTASSEDKLVYGKSELYFKNGSVIGWRIDPVSSPIRVKLWPSSNFDPSLSSYTVGSSKDVVLTVQGTPTAFTEDKFEYGKSEVIFRKNRVVSWKEDPESTPLWAR